MKSSRTPALAILAAVLCLRAAPAGAVDLRLSVPEPLRDAWEEILSRHPLPAEARIVETGEDAARLSLRAFWGAPPFMPGRWVVVQSRLFAPAAVLGSALTGEEPVQPLESINLPLVALPVDGLYPGDADYPLVQKVALVLAGSRPGPGRVVRRGRILGCSPPARQRGLDRRGGRHHARARRGQAPREAGRPGGGLRRHAARPAELRPADGQPRGSGHAKGRPGCEELHLPVRSRDPCPVRGGRLHMALPHEQPFLRLRRSRVHRHAGRA